MKAIILGKKIVARRETLEYASNKFNWQNVVIGVSCYYGFWAWLLSRLLRKKCIYYCIDFYTYRVKKDFLDGFSIWAAMQMDKFLVHHADICWDISERINYGRFELGFYSSDVQERRKNYIGEIDEGKKGKDRIIPLSYPHTYFRYTEQVDKKLLVFVGLDPYGVDIMPPEIKFQWLGNGKMPWYELLNKTALAGIGISCWPIHGNNFYGDPGKTKLYSACGLPVIMTENTPYADIIEKTKAGIIVKYDLEDVRKACHKIWKNYKFYKRNVKKTWEYIDADRVFENIPVLD